MPLKGLITIYQGNGDMQGRAKWSNDHSEILDRGGLRWLVRLFRFYGLRIDHEDRPINWYQAGFLTCFTSGILLFTLVWIFFALFTLKLTVDMVCSLLTVICSMVCPTATILHTCFRFCKYRQFVIDLAVCISEIPRAQDRAVCVKKAEQLVKLTTATTALVSISGLAICSGCGLAIKSKELRDKVWWLIVEQACIGLWYLLAMSFICFYSCFVILSCKLLVMCFDMYIPQAKAEAPTPMAARGAIMGEQLICHRRLSMLVKRANELFSFYMFMSLITEILVITMYGKLYDGTFGGLRTTSIATSFGLFFVYLLSFTSKLVVCSEVNNKEHIHYLLYQNQQVNNNAAITYGGFFAVKRELIFTIAGIILTYALVLRDVKIS